MDTPFSILSLKDFREDQRAFSNKLGENFREWGFCGLKDHGIDTDLLNDTQELFKEFFDLPDDFKKKFLSLHCMVQEDILLLKQKLLKIA